MCVVISEQECLGTWRAHSLAGRIRLSDDMWVFTRLHFSFIANCIQTLKLLYT